MGKYFKWKLLLIIAVIATSLWHAYPPQEKIVLGLDLQGGMHLVLKVDMSALPEAAREDAVDRALEVIRNRIDEFGVREPSIHKQGRDQIVVQLPGVTDRERALDLVGKVALLEFKMVADDPALAAQATEGTVPAGYEQLELKDDTRTETLLVHQEAVLTGDKLVNAGVAFDQGSFGQPIVTLEFDKEGGKIFADVTGEAVAKFRQDGIPRRLAIILDGELRSAPQVKERIPGGNAVITGNFTYQEASDLAIVLRAGALPAPVYVEEERTVGPTLGRDSVERGIKSVLFGALLVLVFMLVYYLKAGLVANVALILNLIILMGALAGFGASLTLPGIAGIILTIGMAVDANVLIYERIREELDIGKTARSAISAGYHKAFSAIIDANVTTLIAAALLFRFGTGPIRGFATTLTIGILASLFTALFVTRLIFDVLARRGTLQLKMFHFFGTTKINFIGKRRAAYVLSLALILTGMSVFVLRGEQNFGVDFSGGTLEEVKFQSVVDVAAIRQAFAAAGIEAQIQQFGGEELNEIIVRSSANIPERIEEVLTSLVGRDHFEVMRIETVGPSVGQALREKAVLALTFALLAMCGYLAWRFQWKFAVAASIATFHDALVAIGLFAMSGRELSLPIIGALLTVVGYSVNDTIVIFDRIREDVKLMRKTPYPEIVNTSINQTLSRTVLTSLTTLLVVVALFFFGGPAINDFAFVLLVGVVVGTYSTMFVAAPLLVDWHGRHAKQHAGSKK